MRLFACKWQMTRRWKLIELNEDPLFRSLSLSLSLGLVIIDQDGVMVVVVVSAMQMAKLNPLLIFQSPDSIQEITVRIVRSRPFVTKFLEWPRSGRVINVQ